MPKPRRPADGVKPRRRRFRGLRWRMALSYVAVSMIPAVVGGMQIAANGSSLDPVTIQFEVDRTARDLAGMFGDEAARDGGLSTQRTFPIGSPEVAVHTYRTLDMGNGFDLQIPYDPGVFGPQMSRFAEPVALATDPSGAIVGTSYPAAFPTGGPITGVLPALGTIPAQVASTGRAQSGRLAGDRDGVDWALEPIVVSSRTAGMVCVLAAEQPGGLSWTSRLTIVTFVGLLILVPLGVLFGLFTMWGPIRRLRRLATASSALAGGDYSGRVPVRGSDELGQLEAQFNAMAARLDDAIRSRGELSAQNARLAERARLAQELHDSISQDLFSLRMTLHGLETSHADEGDLGERLGGLRAMTTRMIRQMRALLLELRPPATGHLDLAAGLEELAVSYRSRLGIRVEARIERLRAAPEAEDALLQIAQEALSNAARHARAEAIVIGLREARGWVQLWVADDGRGFDPYSVETSRGLGLGLARERAQRLGGRLEVESSPGRGTRILVSVPKP